MAIDPGKIDEAILALLYLGLPERCGAWKSFDWGAMGRLHEKGFISDPASTARSVVLTDEGLRESERLFRELLAAARRNELGGGRLANGRPSLGQPHPFHQRAELAPGSQHVPLVVAEEIHVHVAVCKRELQPVKRGTEVPEADEDERDVVGRHVALLSSRMQLLNLPLGFSSLP